MNDLSILPPTCRARAGSRSFTEITCRTFAQDAVRPRHAFNKAVIIGVFISTSCRLLHAFMSHPENIPSCNHVSLQSCATLQYSSQYNTQLLIILNYSTRCNCTDPQRHVAWDLPNHITEPNRYFNEADTTCEELSIWLHTTRVQKQSITSHMTPKKWPVIQHLYR